MKRSCITLLLFFITHCNYAQPIPGFAPYASKENRQKLHRNIVNNTITKGLSVDLTDSTKDLWQEAFWAMELLKYKSAWADHKIHIAFDSIQQHDTIFQRALLELAYTNYPKVFLGQVLALMNQTQSAKIFAMCAVYILASEEPLKNQALLNAQTKQRLSLDKDNPVLLQLLYQLQSFGAVSPPPAINSLFEKDYLPGNVLIISLQRNNRNYPGLVVVRDAQGNFVKENGDQIFFVPQLARSISGLPGYLTNGNTPEGIFRMDGFDTSTSNFIGPTTNIQLTMPFEYTASHFFMDSTLVDSVWTLERYKNLLPLPLTNYVPLHQSYYAGKAGRTEIIAHGTTVDPSYYRYETYAPFTPTLGCLCTNETWDEQNGRLVSSDQQKLVDAVIKAGGPKGYAIVINIDDQQKPVGAEELLNMMRSVNQK